MKKKRDNLITKQDFPGLFQKGLKKARLDKVADKVDIIEDAVRIIKENEQNLKDLGGLKHRLDILDKIYVKVDKIAGDVSTYRGQQELNSTKLSDHDDRIEKLEKHTKLLPLAS